MTTEKVGAITGDLELLTRPTPDGDGVEAFVWYAGARDLYTVAGSLVRALDPAPEEGEHRLAHEAILAHLTTPGGVVSGNESAVNLRDA